jgi:predicted nucleic acid-binding protein
VGLPWESLLAFASLVSNPRVFERPLTVADAWAQVEGWLSRPAVWVPEPTEDHQELLAAFLRAPGASREPCS